MIAVFIGTLFGSLLGLLAFEVWRMSRKPKPPAPPVGGIDRSAHPYWKTHTRPEDKP